MEDRLKQVVSAMVYQMAKAELESRRLDTGLTEAERVALYVWTMDTGSDPLFKRINHAMRTGEGFDELEPMIALMQSALAKLPNYEGKVYRAVKRGGFSGGFPSFDAAHKLDNIVVYKGFTGTSKYSDNALNGNIFCYINSKSGKDISSFSSKPYQGEILFASNVIFDVNGRASTGKVVKLWLQELKKSETTLKKALKW